MKKIPTLFTRIFENHKIIGITETITDGCEDAFLNGLATIKMDGSCCAIINGQLYKRYDAKNGKPIPNGAIKCKDSPDPITGHMPCWVLCDKKNPADKWFFLAYTNSLKGDNSSVNEARDLKDGTYEAIGPHFQGNKYKLDIDVLYKHGSETVNVERTFDGVRCFLENNKIEGLVFWKNGRPVCKIKRSDFGFDW